MSDYFVYMYDLEYLRKNPIRATEKKILLAFEICGKQYQLSEYDSAIEKNKNELLDYYSLLQDFPYTVRKLKNEDKTTKIPFFIIYNDEKLSLYDFFERNRVFENEIPNIDEINGFERKYELSVKLFAAEKHDGFCKVIIETFRVFQDLYSLFSSSRFALLNAYRILHLKSALIWKDGLEQLWLRSIWLNNAIVFYNSCFDRLMQTIWIGFELFEGQKTNKKKTLSKQDLCSVEGLDDIYSCFDYNKHKCLIPENLRNIIEPIYSQKLNAVRQYANSIKHRGGLRYKNIFPFGQIYDYCEDTSYSTFNTRNEKNLDEIIDEVKEYHIAFRELTIIVLQYIIENFQNHGYLKD